MYMPMLWGTVQLCCSVVEHSRHLDRAHSLAIQPAAQELLFPGQEQLHLAVWLLHAAAPLHACTHAAYGRAGSQRADWQSLRSIQPRPGRVCAPADAVGPTAHPQATGQVSVLLIVNNLTQKCVVSNLPAPSIICPMPCTLMSNMQTILSCSFTIHRLVRARKPPFCIWGVGNARAHAPGALGACACPILVTGLEY